VFAKIKEEKKHYPVKNNTNNRAGFAGWNFSKENPDSAQ
jgi:hypothetical protein